jgi:hypothetical protein
MAGVSRFVSHSVLCLQYNESLRGDQAQTWTLHLQIQGQWISNNPRPFPSKPLPSHYSRVLSHVGTIQLRALNAVVKAVEACRVVRRRGSHIS